MSTLRDEYQQIEQNAEREIQSLERQKPFLQPERDIFENSSQVMSSIYKIVEGEEIIEGALTVTERKLKFFGCDFIKGGYLFLKGLKCPADARDFILILLAISGGNSEQKLIITDDRVAELSGLSKKTIQRKRKALKAWQQAKNWKVIEVWEGPRDRDTRRYLPTEYRVRFADFLIRFVWEMRSIIHPKPLAIAEPRDDKESPALWGEMKREKGMSAFPENISDRDVERIAVRISDDFEDAPIPTREERMGGSKSNQRRDRLAAFESIALKAITDARDELVLRKVSPHAWWAEFKRKGAQLIGQYAETD